MNANWTELEIMIKVRKEALHKYLQIDCNAVLTNLLLYVGR